MVIVRITEKGYLVYTICGQDATPHRDNSFTSRASNKSALVDLGHQWTGVIGNDLEEEGRHLHRQVLKHEGKWKVEGKMFSLKETKEILKQP